MSNLLMSTLVKRIEGNVSRGNEHLRPMLTISFDDGYDSDYNIVFPILKELGIRSTFFILGDKERMQKPAMVSGSQLREMALSGQEIASHGKEHLSYFSTQDHDILLADMLESNEVIESHTKMPVRTFAFPYGGDEGYDSENPATLEDALRIQNLLGGVYEAVRGTSTHSHKSGYEKPMDNLMLYGDKNIYNVPCRLSDGGYNKRQIPNIVDNMITMEEPAWQNIAFHRIYPDGATDKPENRMFESEFRTLMEYISEKKEQKLIDVVPFYEGARRIRTGISTKLEQTYTEP